MSTVQLTAACAACGKESKNPKPNKAGDGVKVPFGWRRVDGVGLLCRACTKTQYYTRSIRVEIMGVDGERPIEEFRAALGKASKDMARLANWITQRLFAADELASAEPGKKASGKVDMPACPDVLDYYARAREACPHLAAQTVPGFYRMVKGWYSSRRFEMFVALNRTTDNYRFGSLPIEITQQSWSLRENDGRLFVRTQVGPGKSWDVKIYAAGAEMAKLRQIHSGEARPLGLKIVRASKPPLPGSHERRQAWFFRISAMFPRRVRRQSSQEITLTLRHDRDVLLFGSLESKEDVFEFPGLSLRSMIVGGDKRDRQRQQEQSLQRGLWPRRKVARWGKDRSNVAANGRRKVKAQLKLAAAALARWCESHGVTSVGYDATDRQFVPHMPRHELYQNILCVLESRGIALHVIGDAPPAHEPNQEEAGAIAGPECETGAR